MINEKVSDQSICRIATGAASRILVGRQSGEVALHDFRKNFKVVHKVCSGTGSIADMDTRGRAVAVCGYDRYLRVFDYEGREEVAKVYMKQIQNCLLIEGHKEAKGESVAPSKRQREEETKEEIDEVGTQPVRKRKRKESK